MLTAQLFTPGTRPSLYYSASQVFERLFPHIVVLSQNKFASNVVEKMLLHCEPQQRAAIVEEFLRQPPGAVPAPEMSDDANARDQSPLEQMMQDQYGNYVVQKTLEVRVTTCMWARVCVCRLVRGEGLWLKGKHAPSLAVVRGDGRGAAARERHQ